MKSIKKAVKEILDKVNKMLEEYGWEEIKDELRLYQFEFENPNFPVLSVQSFPQSYELYSTVCYLQHFVGRGNEVVSETEEAIHIVFDRERPKGMAYCFRFKDGVITCTKHPIGMCPYSTYKIVSKYS